MSDIAKEFTAELRSLLEKYDAELDVEYEKLDYGVDIKGIFAYIPSIYTADGRLLREGTTIQYSKYVDSETI